MTNRIMPNYLRDLARCLERYVERGALDDYCDVDKGDIEQLIDLADTLDVERETNLTSLLANFAAA